MCKHIKKINKILFKNKTQSTFRELIYTKPYDIHNSYGIYIAKLANLIYIVSQVFDRAYYVHIPQFL